MNLKRTLSSVVAPLIFSDYNKEVISGSGRAFRNLSRMMRLPFFLLSDPQPILPLLFFTDEVQHG